MTYLGGDLVNTLSITNERIAIGVAFLGVQQIAWLLWKFLHAG